MTITGEYDNEVKKKLGLDVWTLLIKEVNDYRIIKNPMQTDLELLEISKGEGRKRELQHMRLNGGESSLTGTV